MDPPTLSGKPLVFWGDIEEDIKATLDQNLAWLYFRFSGSADGVFPGQWRQVTWTLDDFVYFFDCPETEAAWTSYVNDYLSTSWATARPIWSDVVDAMQHILTRPEDVPNYLNLRPADQIDKSRWNDVDHVVAFIFRLLNYRNHIEEGAADTRDDFQARQAAYAGSFGRDNPFYFRWDSADKWAAAFLLYAKLIFRRDMYVADQLKKNPKDFYEQYTKAIAEGNPDLGLEERYLNISKGLIREKNTQPNQKPAQEPDQQPDQQPVQQPPPEPTQTLTQEITKEPTQETPQEPGQGPGQQPDQLPVEVKDRLTVEQREMMAQAIAAEAARLHSEWLLKNTQHGWFSSLKFWG
ncbi:hypothetical protein F4781DRAFT_432081 [Annulohypoxylon bovei var. microspora]|nr:hypothetical protein F4781DRAFT_432081 [Annulohypoxylon bovei var. microspora]